MGLPEKEGIIGYDQGKYNKGVGQVRRTRAVIDSLQAQSLINPVEKTIILATIREAVEGALMASEAIHHPVTTPEEIEALAKKSSLYRLTSQPGDYQTDAQGLEDLPQIFF